MSIRVLCTECHSASQVVDDAAGYQATCPFCESVFDVPAQPVSAVRDQAAQLAAQASTPSLFLRGRPLSSGIIELGRIDPRSCGKIAIKLYKAHPRLLLASHLIYFATFVGFSLCIEALAKSGKTEVAGALQMFAIPITMFLNMGLTIVCLHIARNEEADVTAMISGADRLLRVVVFNVLLAILVGLTSIGFLVPGIYMALRFWSGSHFIVDRNCGVFEAFGLAGSHSDGNRIPSLMLALMSVGVLSLVAPSVLIASSLPVSPVLGALPFFAAVVIVLPLITLMWTVAYLMLTRQSIELPTAGSTS